ncbi:MAG: ADP-ribosylglycohydrolase family protein [Saccharofermentanales bacterium]
MNMNLEDYRKKVYGCWMGKNIGGTFGAPFEWKRQINEATFYTQELGGNPLPNDDLDLQLLWLIALEEKGIDINARILGEYWLAYITPHWAEYGFAKINMKSGIMPPLSGSENNSFQNSCGAFIRSEIWACIAPGAPKIAARYAFEDAIVDHGYGEGTNGEIFCATLESAAFLESDINKLIDIGLSYIPGDCGVANAIRCAISSYKEGKTWLEARDEMLSKYRGSSSWFTTSERDRKLGFDKGIIGWDVPANIGMLIIGLLYGEGDFEKSLCIAINCGEDTDCTGATIGSIFGLIHGIDAIPEKWINPIGTSIKTACLNLGELGYFGSQIPDNLDNLTSRVETITKQVILKNNLPLKLTESKPTDLTGYNIYSLYSSTNGVEIYNTFHGPLFHFDFFDVIVGYSDGINVKNGVPKKISLIVVNTYKTPVMLNIQWYKKEGWAISPSESGKFFSSEASFGENKNMFDFELKSDVINDNLIRFVVEITIDGRHSVMLIPIILINGNLI